jgi:type VI secretion system secreted protein VgrG
MAAFDPTALATSTDDALFHLRIEGFPADHFPVDTWHGREAMSEAYSFDVVTTVTTDSDEELERTALGQRAAFVWKTDKGERAFYGVVAAVRLARVHEIAPRSIQIHLRLVPRLWLLKRRKRTRIFQGMRAPEIIDAVLEGAGISARWQLLRDHTVRTYATQYEESDLAFVKRLCAEAGIAFYFPTGAPLEPGAADDAVIPGDTVIFTDDASFYPPMGGDDPGAFTDAPSAASNAPSAGEAPTLYHLGREDMNVQIWAGILTNLLGETAELDGGHEHAGRE